MSIHPELRVVWEGRRIRHLYVDGPDGGQFDLVPLLRVTHIRRDINISGVPEIDITIRARLVESEQ